MPATRRPATRRPRTHALRTRTHGSFSTRRSSKGGTDVKTPLLLASAVALSGLALLAAGRQAGAASSTVTEYQEEAVEAAAKEGKKQKELAEMKKRQQSCMAKGKEASDAGKINKAIKWYAKAQEVADEEVKIWGEIAADAEVKVAKVAANKAANKMTKERRLEGSYPKPQGHRTRKQKRMVPETKTSDDVQKIRDERAKMANANVEAAKKTNKAVAAKEEKANARAKAAKEKKANARARAAAAKVEAAKADVAKADVAKADVAKADVAGIEAKVDKVLYRQGRPRTRVQTAEELESRRRRNNAFEMERRKTQRTKEELERRKILKTEKKREERMNRFDKINTILRIKQQEEQLQQQQRIEEELRTTGFPADLDIRQASKCVAQTRKSLRRPPV